MQNSPFTHNIHSVSEITDQIKNLLESGFSDVLVEGELSNVSRSRSGHLYFTVKDSDAQLSCVIWKYTAERLGLDLADGQQVVLGGNIQVYPPHGRYQLIVSFVEQAGTGKLQQAFEELKKKLKEEGLFEDLHKKKLPVFPKKIGVITSSTGAAFHDVRSTIEKRWPVAQILLYHSSVQGVNAVPELVNGLTWFSEQRNADVLIIGRGGGSLEDLWPFNEESVARAIFDCPIPVVSSVGHEVDFSISDFVADARAATPTQAAVMVTPDIHEIRFLIDDLEKKLTRRVREQINAHKEKVQRLSGSHALLVTGDRIKHYQEQIGMFRERIRNRTDKQITRFRDQLLQLTHRMEKSDPNAPLKKGYVRVWQDKKWIRRSPEFNQKETFELEWESGSIEIERK